MLATDAYRQFLKTLIRFVEIKYPHETHGKSKQEIENRLWYCINKARNYGIAFEQDIALFVVFCMIIGDDFDEQKENQHLVNILQDETQPMKNRLDTMGEIIFSN